MDSVIEAAVAEEKSMRKMEAEVVMKRTIPTAIGPSCYFFLFAVVMQELDSNLAKKAAYEIDMYTAKLANLRHQISVGTQVYM